RRRMHAADVRIARIDRARIPVVAGDVAEALHRHRDADPLVPAIRDEDAAVAEGERLRRSVEARAKRVPAVATVRRAAVADERRYDGIGADRPLPVRREATDPVVPLVRDEQRAVRVERDARRIREARVVARTSVAEIVRGIAALAVE